MNKSTKKEQYIEKQKKEYSIKVTTIIKVLVIAILLAGSYILGWNARSEFANEVKSEVKNQMSVMQEVNTLKANQ